MMRKIDRRSFLKGMGVVSAACAMTVLTGCEDAPAGDGSVSLASLKPFNGKLKWNNDFDPVDPFGNSYSKSANYIVCAFEKEKEWDFLHHYDYAYGYGYAEYRVEKKYKKLTMKLAPHELMNTNGNAYVEVYADDKLVVKSDLITRKTSAVNLEADITNAEYIQLKIYVHTGSSIGEGMDGNDGALIIADAKLWK